jgi:hypothetical protein
MRAPIGIFGLLALAACGGKSGPTGTGGGPDPYACLGQPLPTTAPSAVSVTGVVRSNALAPSPLAGASVKGFQTGNATALDSSTSDAGGNYSMTLSTGGTPLDGYIRVSKSSYLDTYGYPPQPLAANISESVLLITSTELGIIGGALGVTPTAGDGLIAVVVEDCSGLPLAGASVSTNPPGTVKYNSGGGPSSSATMTSADGVAYVLNVTAGDVVVMASAGGHVLRQHTVNARADVITLTAIAPGPLQ